MRTLTCALAPLVAVFLFGGLRPSSRPDADDAIEPPMEFRLLRGQEATPVRLDEPFQLKTDSGALELVLVVDPLRTFRRAGISFRYPREYVFEADQESPVVTIWTLSGNDVLIMVMRYASLTDHEELRRSTVEAIEEQYGGGTTSTPVSFTAGGKVLPGTRVTVRVADVPLVQEVYSFVSDGKAFLLMLQDSPDDPGTPTREYGDVVEILASTLVLEAP